MKKIAIILFSIMFCMACLCACGPKPVRYDLVEMKLANVSVSQYAYNYIEFDYKKGTYKLQNKVEANGIITRQTGEFTVDEDNNISFTNDFIPTQNYVLYINERAYFEGELFCVEANIPGLGEVYMIFEKN